MNLKGIAEELEYMMMRLSEMGRKRNKAHDQAYAFQDEIDDHLWKLFVYHTHRPRNINGWLRELNAFSKQLAKMNIPKKRKKRNFTKKFLMDIYYDDLFGTDDDIKIRLKQGIQAEYPKVDFKDIDQDKLKNFVELYIDSILNAEVFRPNKNQLN